MSDLPSGWAWAELSQICTSITDGDHQPPPQTSSGIPFLVIGNIRNRRLDFSDCRYVSEEYYHSLKSIRRPQKGDVLYSLVGSYGIPALVRNDAPFCVQRHIGILRPSLEVSASFLAYLLSSADVYDQATSCATGTAQLTVPLAGLRRIRVPVPPRDEQEMIVAAIEEQFSRLDSGIAALRRAKKSLSLMKTAQLQTLMPASAVLPDGWRWGELGDVVAAGPKNGIYLPGNRYGSGIPILRIDDFQNEWQRPRSSLRLVTPDPGQAEEFALSTGDLVINRVNSMTHLGKCLVAGPDLEGALFESNMMRIQLSSEVDQDYIKLYLQSPAGRSLLLKRAKQAVNQASINQRDVRSTPVVIPPLHEQRRIVSIYQTSSSILSKIENEVDMAIRHSDSLRASILASALSGKLIPIEQVTA